MKEGGRVGERELNMYNYRGVCIAAKSAIKAARVGGALWDYCVQLLHRSLQQADVSFLSNVIYCLALWSLKLEH